MVIYTQETSPYEWTQMFIPVSTFFKSLSQQILSLTKSPQYHVSIITIWWKMNGGNWQDTIDNLIKISIYNKLTTVDSTSQTVCSSTPFC